MFFFVFFVDYQVLVVQVPVGLAKIKFHRVGFNILQVGQLEIKPGAEVEVFIRRDLSGCQTIPGGMEPIRADHHPGPQFWEILPVRLHPDHPAVFLQEPRAAGIQ